MKLYWKIIGAVGFAAILGTIGASALISNLPAEKADTFFILNTSLYNPDFLDELEDRLTKEDAYDVLRKTPSVYAHRLIRGNGTIFAYRWFSEGSTDVIDDERFEKITIWLPEVPSERDSKFNLSNRRSVIVVYTNGGSAWPDDACSGYLNSGQLVIQRKDDRYVVSLEGALKPTGAQTLPELCSPKTIAKKFETTELERNELTTWLGKRGRHPYDETYR